MMGKTSKARRDKQAARVDSRNRASAQSAGRSDTVRGSGADGRAEAPCAMEARSSARLRLHSPSLQPLLSRCPLPCLAPCLSLGLLSNRHQPACQPTDEAILTPITACPPLVPTSQASQRARARGRASQQTNRQVDGGNGRSRRLVLPASLPPRGPSQRACLARRRPPHRARRLGARPLARGSSSSSPRQR